jgi:hypothetical protein
MVHTKWVAARARLGVTMVARLPLAFIYGVQVDGVLNYTNRDKMMYIRAFSLYSEVSCVPTQYIHSFDIKYANFLKPSQSMPVTSVIQYTAPWPKLRSAPW